MAEGLEAPDSYLTFAMDGRWSADDFAALFSSVSTLYYIEFAVYGPRFVEESERIVETNSTYRGEGFSFLDDHLWLWRHYPWSAFLSAVRRLLGIRPPEWQPPRKTVDEYIRDLKAYNPGLANLMVTHVQYASPGEINFKGSGEIIKEVRETILTITNADHRRKMEHIELRKARADALAAEQEAEMKRVELWKKKAEFLRAVGMDEEFIREAIAREVEAATSLSALAYVDKLQLISDGH